MSDTTYTDYDSSNPVRAAWLNDVNAATYRASSWITNAVNRPAIQKFADVISILDFGAVADATTAGAGTDSTAAVNLALVSVTDTGNTSGTALKGLYVPGGNYLVGNITLPVGTKMRGDSRLLSNFIAKTGTTGLWWTDAGSAAKICLEDLAFYGRSLSGLTYGLRLGYGGGSQHGTEAYLRNLFVREINGTGALWGVDINTNVGIYDGITVWNVPGGIRITGSAGMASKLIVENPTSTGVELNLCDAYSVEIEAPGNSCVPLKLSGNSHVSGLTFSLANGTVIDHLAEFGASCTTWAMMGVNLVLPATITVTSGNYKRSDGTFFGGNASGGNHNGEGNWSSAQSPEALSVSGALPQAHGLAFPSIAVAVSDPNTLDDYEEYTAAAAACTGAVTATVTWTAVKVGKLVTLTLPVTKSAGVAATSFTYGTVLPAKYRPATNLVSASAYITDNATELATPGLFFINASTGQIAVYKEGTRAVAFTAAAQAGLTYGATISWVVP